MNGTGAMLWLCLHFPLLPLEVFTRAGEQGDMAIAVIEQQRVLCASARAQQQGVAPGLSSATAQALCAGLRLVERHAPRERAALHTLADRAYCYTPMLALQPPAALLLEISASLRLFGGLAALLEQIEADLAERRHGHLAGLAPTPRGAQLMTRALPCSSRRLPEWCASGDTEAFRRLLDTLPLGLLDLPEKQLQALQRMGFARIGELRALPHGALGKRFGRDLPGHLQQLYGEQPDLRMPYRPRDFFHAELHFMDPLTDRAALLFPMQRMLRELVAFLERRQSHCQRLEWRMRGTRGEDCGRLGIRCSLAHNSHAALLDLTRLALEQLEPAQPVESLALLCREFTAVHQHSAELFNGGTSQTMQAECLLLDRLVTRLGSAGVHGIRLADAHLPELAWRQANDDEPGGGIAPRAQRPCWLLQQPVPLQQRAGALAWNGRLELLNGPERIESGWWGTPCGRDYFIARHENGSLCWVFREHRSRRWFVHGLFG